MPVTFDPAQDSLLKGNVYRYSRCWQIVRTDGVTFEFTDHSNTLEVRTGFTDDVPDFLSFLPSDGLDTSAAQHKQGFGQSNVEAQGVVSSTKITEDDLRAGKFRDATITEYLVDWKYPFAGYFERSKYLILKVKWASNLWVADLVVKTKWMEKPDGHRYTRNCRWQFGVDPCNINLATDEDVHGLPIRRTSMTITALDDTKRKKFRISGLNDGLSGTYLDNDFNYGSVTFTSGGSGKLTGVVMEIIDFEASTLEFTCNLSTPFDMSDGSDPDPESPVADVVTVVQGCSKTLTACDDRWNQAVSTVAYFGGFPYIPGSDKMSIIPDQRT